MSAPKAKGNFKKATAHTLYDTIKNHLSITDAYPKPISSRKGKDWDYFMFHGSDRKMLKIMTQILKTLGCILDKTDKSKKTYHKYFYNYQDIPVTLLVDNSNNTSTIMIGE